MRLNQQQESREGRPCSRIWPGAIQTYPTPFLHPMSPSLFALQLSLAIPDLSRHKVQDLFSALGPVAVFNARHFWSAPRVVRLRKRESEGFGFSVRGDSPVVVAGVDHRSLAQVRTYYTGSGTKKDAGTAIWPSKL